jgi:hypothetical protein
VRRTCFVLLTSLGFACGGSDPSTPSAPSSATQAVAEPGTFRVATFNIQHGLNNDGRYDLKYAIQAIAFYSRSSQVSDTRSFLPQLWCFFLSMQRKPAR